LHWGDSAWGCPNHVKEAIINVRSVFIASEELGGPALATDLTLIGDRSFSGQTSLPASGNRAAIGAGKPAKVDFDVDEKGRFVKISSGDETTRTVFTFSDFGTAADITAPPPQDVAEESVPAFLPAIPLLG
jgi:hypothetical protein